MHTTHTEGNPTMNATIRTITNNVPRDIDAANKLGAVWYRIVKHTGADYGDKVVA